MYLGFYQHFFSKSLFSISLMVKIKLRKCEVTNVVTKTQYLPLSYLLMIFLKCVFGSTLPKNNK